MEPLRIFIGYDPREHEAYEVCVHSLRRHASVPLSITPLKQDALRKAGLYRRYGVNGLDWVDSSPFSTEFSFTRFLVPALCQYEGFALFCDCDFLFRADVAELFDLIKPEKAVSVVFHDHQPSEDVKMDGVPQTSYFRKNWSSLVVWNCGHRAHDLLTVDDVSTKPGQWLHQFRWIKDLWNIGEIPQEWNWLEGASPPIDNPKAVHFTRGGPWFADWLHVDYADEWLAEREML